MRKNLQAVTVAALATTTLLGASPAHATDETHVPAVTVTVGTFSPLVAYHGTASVDFVVRADGVPLARHATQLCTAPIDGDWTCATALTSSAGKVTGRRARLVAPLQIKLVVPESDTSEAVATDPVVVRPQVAVAVVRKKTTMTVTLSVAADQHLVVKRQEGGRWLVDRHQRAAQRVTMFDGLRTGTLYQVVVSDTPAIRGGTSKAV